MRKAGALVRSSACRGVLAAASRAVRHGRIARSPVPLVAASASSSDPRDETPAQRADRNLAELLQELRVAGLGVQVLFGFLLSLPFSARFTRLNHPQRDLYLASLVLAAVVTALLLGPVAYHRLVFRRAQKESLVRAASVMALVGLAAVGLAISAAVLLVTGMVAGGLPAALITIFVACLFAALWFAFPLARRRERERADDTGLRPGAER